jgi:GH25 family lysozyme M1 (1,4-beta-N-acetylmuramidase)
MVNKRSNSVIDISHHNGARLRFDKAKADGIIGVIQKTTQGITYVDATFHKNKKAILAEGLLFGAYHFGDGSDGRLQAKHFLDVVQPNDDTVIVLDFESNPGGPSMTLGQAHAFVTHVKLEVARWPGFYSGHDIKEALGKSVDPILKNCWFWLAQYGPRPVVPPCWKKWTLWQYTDGGVGPRPHAVDGIGPCDRDIFNGTRKQLKSWWGT